jgi:hypothetical protein
MDLIQLEIPKPELPWLEREREMRRLALLDADRDLQEATNAVKKYQGENFSLDTNGARVPRIRSGDVMWADELEHKLHRLIQEVSAKHDEFQRALKSWSELQP